MRAAIITILSVLPGLRAVANFALRKTKPTLSEMNKKLLILAVAACLGLPSASAAATALALTLADGSTPAYFLTERPSVYFSGADMTVTAANVSTSYPRAEVMSMKFIENPATAVTAIEDSQETMGYDGRCVTAPGKRIDMYSIDGKAVASAMESLPVDGLATGVYIVRAGRQSLKISIR